MAHPRAYFAWPDEFFQFLPERLPTALPPPIRERSLRSPFGINKTLFDTALRPEVPLVIAATYIVSVAALNAYNRRHSWKPWATSRTRAFYWFVVLHNVLLTVYSFATFFAMSRALRRIWPGWGTGAGTAGIADALCKLHGPRGIGDAVTYNTTLNIWETKNNLIKLAYDGTPDQTDVGRLWNEGLAFWGWIFYLSKFYEVVDTLIIIAKGKRSATLQTYHHAGAMLCMWSGIRYMSPPIWMFVWMNSFIHFLMYTYFTLSAVGVRVPSRLKRTLTTMQISQFLAGASYAAVHLFVRYDMPVRTPYQVAKVVQEAASSISAAAASATSAVSGVVDSPIATSTLGALLKKLLLRAAGEEGVAERVQQPYVANAVPSAIQQALQDVKPRTRETYETHWRTDYARVNCLDTSGEAFAIYLNLMYLAPLTFLFARFFVKAYVRRSKPADTRAAREIRASAEEAKDRTQTKLEQNGTAVESKISSTTSDIKRNVQDQVDEDLRKVREGTYEAKQMSNGHATGAKSPKKKKKKNNNKNSSPKQGTESSGNDDKTYAEAVREDQGDDGSKDDSAAEQEETLAATEGTRPGASAMSAEAPLPEQASAD